MTVRVLMRRLISIRLAIVHTKRVFITVYCYSCSISILYNTIVPPVNIMILAPE